MMGIPSAPCAWQPRSIAVQTSTRAPSAPGASPDRVNLACMIQAWAHYWAGRPWCCCQVKLELLEGWQVYMHTCCRSRAVTQLTSPLWQGTACCNTKHVALQLALPCHSGPQGPLLTRSSCSAAAKKPRTAAPQAATPQTTDPLSEPCCHVPAGAPAFEEGPAWPGGTEACHTCRASQHMTATALVYLRLHALHALRGLTGIF